MNVVIIILNRSGLMRSRGQIYFDLQIQFVLNLNFWFGFWMIRGEFDILYSQGMIKKIAIVCPKTHR